ncbi:CHASE2 domain-containing protein [cf. Phormidesmis sp. LEGE 11477]|uniref:CHASE2 domain-containing protein n=1 Tax=cf. Phormidesmis sp. LEGE 11477 TaxID=1828680 RepID=UPI0018815AFF|nr:CHASE2 domain-containing protein [cf. Phormidesmis sp. LEGE 11477]MBE9062420.1 CHASE2 domain-containing protein [cf. Phormidesmis sp. LEGE 11477]
MPFSLFRERSLKQFGRSVLLTSLVLTGLVAVSRELGLLESMELSAYDQFVRMQPADPIDQRILVVGISEDDFQARQEYPIEDGTLADLLVKLKSYNPRAIGLDIARDIPQGSETGRSRLINLLQESDRIVSACLLSSAQDSGVPPIPGADPELVGFADLPQDFDGRIRRSILISSPGETTEPIQVSHLCNDVDASDGLLSLSFLLSLIYLEQENVAIDETQQGYFIFEDTVLTPLFERSGGYARTGASDYQTMLDYRSARQAVRQVSLGDVLNDTVDPTWIRDRVVLIGNTSQISNDFFLTPYEDASKDFREMAGVVIHAQIVSQLISAALDNRPLIHSWPEVLEISWIFVGAVVGGSLAFYNRRLVIFVFGCVGLIFAYWGVCFVLFFSQGLWLPFVPSAIAFVLSAIGVGILDRAHEGGYAQAIYQQLREQKGTSTASSARSQGYLEDLVHRARLIRQQREGEALWHSEATLDIETDPNSVRFESPEMQDLYERIKAKAQRDWEEAHAAEKKEQAQRKAWVQQQRIQALLGRARMVRETTSRTIEEIE